MEKKTVFSNGVSLDVSSTLQGKAHAQKYLANSNSKNDSVLCVMLFLLFCYSLYYWFLFSWNCAWGIFFERHKEQEVHWVRKWEYWGREKSMIKLYSMQKNFKKKNFFSKWNTFSTPSAWLIEIPDYFYPRNCAYLQHL